MTRSFFISLLGAIQYCQCFKILISFRISGWVGQKPLFQIFLNRNSLFKKKKKIARLFYLPSMEVATADQASLTLSCNVTIFSRLGPDRQNTTIHNNAQSSDCVKFFRIINLGWHTKRAQICRLRSLLLSHQIQLIIFWIRQSAKRELRTSLSQSVQQICWMRPTCIDSTHQVEVMSGEFCTSF